MKNLVVTLVGMVLMALLMGIAPFQGTGIAKKICTEVGKELDALDMAFFTIHRDVPGMVGGVMGK